MEQLAKFTKTVDKISEFFGTISMYIVIVTFIVGFLNVVLRYTGELVGRRLTSNVFIELQWYLYSLIFFLGFAYILKNGINVRVDFWFADQPKKLQAKIDLVGHLIALIPFCLLALWATWNPVLRSWGLRPDGSWGTWEMSPDPNGLPRAPIKSMIVIAFVLLLLQAIAEVIKLIAILRDQEHLVQTAEIDAPIRIE